jgi:UrcA family protein
MFRPLPVLFAAASLTLAGYAHAQPYSGPYYDRSYDEPSVGELTVTPPARSGVERRFTRVSFADLDLSGPEGAYTLLGRIRGAARQVCGPQPTTPVDLRDDADYRGCVQDAVVRAVDDVGAPAVEEMYRYTYDEWGPAAP